MLHARPVALRSASFLEHLHSIRFLVRHACFALSFKLHAGQRLVLQLYKILGQGDVILPIALVTGPGHASKEMARATDEDEISAAKPSNIAVPRFKEGRWTLRLCQKPCPKSSSSCSRALE